LLILCLFIVSSLTLIILPAYRRQKSYLSSSIKIELITYKYALKAISGEAKKLSTFCILVDNFLTPFIRLNTM